MNLVLKVFLSMSVSGGLLILILFFGKLFLKDKISRQWQYYIWLIVILRLLLPFGPETNLLGEIYRAIDQAIVQSARLQHPSPLHASENVLSAADGLEHVEYENESANRPSEDSTAVQPFQDIVSLLINHIWLIWLVAALGMLIRKVTVYQGFIRYINVGLNPVSDIGMLDRLSAAAEQSGIKKPIELCVNPLVSSPLLIGFPHPCIVLPDADISEQDFRYIVLHELTHYKRRDTLYKWLVQITVCLHWFNPLVYLMSWEITRACEFSCDEAVLAQMGHENAQDYGKTLLDAMAAVGKYKENFGAFTLSGNKQLLKERLGAIMNFRKKSKAIRLLTGALTMCVIFGAAFVGIYPANAADDKTLTTGQDEEATLPAQKDVQNEASYSLAEQYYETGSVPLFQIVFSRLDEKAQEEWLDRIYTDNDIAFAAAAIQLLDEDCALVQRFAERAYNDGDVAFFSGLATYMSEDTLEMWLDKALEDENWTFQSVLFNVLERDDEFDELEEKRKKEWDEAQRAEYQAVGVTIDGKKYYYQGQLVNIFLDIRANQSFCTLDMNPAGTVNIKIIRNTDNEITGVAYMTDEEITELFGESSK